MDVNLELIKRIISSDELCDKVNSGDNSDYYKNQIENYVLFLINDNANANIDVINRYIRKFVLGENKEDIFFNKVLLKLYNLDIKNSDFLSILDSFNFSEMREILVKKYNEFIINKIDVSNEVLIRMISLYYYVCPNYIFPSHYVDYFTYYLYSKNVVLDFDLLSYFYKQFALSFSESKKVTASFLILDNVIKNDPYYDNNGNKIIIYKNNIGKNVDPNVFADIFYQITYLFILKSINDSNNKCYSFEQLQLVKEICLQTLLGTDYYELNYGDISFSSVLKKQSEITVSDYFRKLNLNVVLRKSIDETLVVDNLIGDEDDKVISVDILFEQTLKRENPNLLSSLIKNYPILGSEYKNNVKKSLLTLILDIYNNKKLLNNLNKDLDWYKGKLSKDDEVIIRPKIDRLSNKISICSSYINVMSSIILNGDITSYDLLRSVSDLITYNGSNKIIKNDIYSILRDIIPKKIKRLCADRNETYRENLKKKVIKCYLDSMGLFRSEIDIDYFMKIYSTLELCISAFDID